MIVEWDVASRLVTPAGTLLFNQEVEDVGWFLLNPEKCVGGLPVRIVSDDVPQGHGRLHHPRWWSGYEIHLAIQLWETKEKPACGQRLREMGDIVARHVNALMLPFPQGQGPRFFMQPTGYGDERMLMDSQLSSSRIFSVRDTEVEFDIDSEVPYLMDSEEIVTEISDGSSETINNAGSVDFKPVMKINGPASFVTITNNSVTDLFGDPLKVRYDDSLSGAVAIGGSDYVEIDFRRESVYLNGNESRRVAGIDVRRTDFFPLAPGDNDIEVDGADVTVLSNGAWA